jgi:hypothetical protein
MAAEWAEDGGSVDALLRLDPERVPNGEVLAVLDAVEAARRALDAKLVEIVAQTHRRAVAKDNGASSTSALLRHRLLMRPGDAAGLTQVARAVSVPPGAVWPGTGSPGTGSPGTGSPPARGDDGECAATGKALAAAEISYHHARVIVEALDDLTAAVDAPTGPRSRTSC